MKLNYKIEYNHTLEEYESKIKKVIDKHVKISLEEAQDFDKKYHAYTYDEATKEYTYQYRILNNKTWWFIDGIFYEVPSRFVSHK